MAGTSGKDKTVSFPRTFADWSGVLQPGEEIRWEGWDEPKRKKGDDPVVDRQIRSAGIFVGFFVALGVASLIYIMLTDGFRNSSLAFVPLSLICAPALYSLFDSALGSRREARTKEAAYHATTDRRRLAFYEWSNSITAARTKNEFKATAASEIQTSACCADTANRNRLSAKRFLILGVPILSIVVLASWAFREYASSTVVDRYGDVFLIAFFLPAYLIGRSKLLRGRAAQDYDVSGPAGLKLKEARAVAKLRSTLQSITLEDESGETMAKIARERISEFFVHDRGDGSAELILTVDMIHELPLLLDSLRDALAVVNQPYASVVEEHSVANECA